MICPVCCAILITTNPPKEEFQLAYSQADILADIEKAAAHMEVFYQKPFINYRGKTSNTGEYFTEIISRWLVEHPQKLHEIPEIMRKESYKTNSHDGIPPSSNSMREEELVAMALYRQNQLPGLGEVIDYQTPLKNERDDSAGKIDVLSYDGHTLRVLELKKKDSTETMLRCVLEGYTYMQTAYLPKLLHDLGLPADAEITTNPLVFHSQKQHQEMAQHRPWLKKLMAHLNIVPLYLNEDETGYWVTIA